MRARVRIAVFAACWLIATAASAQRIERVAIEDFTWTELATALKELEEVAS